jgi:hypothetical protein
MNYLYIVPAMYKLIARMFCYITPNFQISRKNEWSECGIGKWCALEDMEKDVLSIKNR